MMKQDNRCDKPTKYLTHSEDYQKHINIVQFVLIISVN